MLQVVVFTIVRVLSTAVRECYCKSSTQTSNGFFQPFWHRICKPWHLTSDYESKESRKTTKAINWIVYIHEVSRVSTAHNSTDLYHLYPTLLSSLDSKWLLTVSPLSNYTVQGSSGQAVAEKKACCAAITTISIAFKLTLWSPLICQSTKRVNVRCHVISYAVFMICCAAPWFKVSQDSQAKVHASHMSLPICPPLWEPVWSNMVNESNICPSWCLINLGTFPSDLIQ